MATTAQIDTLGIGSVIHAAREVADAKGLPQIERPKCIWPAATTGTPEERIEALAKPTRSIAAVTGQSPTKGAGGKKGSKSAPPSAPPPSNSPAPGHSESLVAKRTLPATTLATDGSEPPAALLGASIEPLPEALPAPAPHELAPVDDTDSDDTTLRPVEPVLVSHAGTELRIFEVSSGQTMSTKAFSQAYDMTQKEVSKYISTQKRYAGLTCRLDAPYAAIVGGHINTFKGFTVVPTRHPISATRMACDGLLDFLFEVIAAGDDVSYAYHYNYLAWLWQRKNQAPDVVMVLKSAEEGTGKSTYGLILEKLFAPAGVVLTSAKDVTGAFNSMLEGKRVVVVEETIFAGDPRNGATMRALVTGKKLRIERKYHEAHTVDNTLAIVLNTNDEWVAPVTATDRRYAVFRVSAGRKGDKAYWDNMARMLRDRRVIEDLAYELETHHLGDWHPRDHIPETEERVDQKLATVAGKLEGFLYDVLDAGRFATRDGLSIIGDNRSKEGHWATDGIALTKDMLGVISAMAAEYTKRHITRTKMTRALRKYMGACDARTSTERRYNLPPLAEARVVFEKQFEGARIEWFDAPEKPDKPTTT